MFPICLVSCWTVVMAAILSIDVLFLENGTQCAFNRMPSGGDNDLAKQEKNSEKNLIKTAFEMLDKEGKGCLSREELRKGFQILGHNPTVQQVDDIMSELGVTGTVDYKGFERCMKALESEDCLQGERELKEAFRVFDKDGNGYIDRKELSIALKELGEHFTESEVDHMFSLADFDDDGKIKYEEFIKILLQ